VFDGIGSLWEKGPGSIVASPSSYVRADAAVQRRRTLALRFWMVWMIFTGGAVDFIVDIFDSFMHARGFGAEISVFIVTAFSFVGSGVPPSLSKTDRQSVTDVNRQNPYFKYKVMVPGLADLAITSMRYAAILYISPAIASMLKTASQLVTLTLIQHVRGKRINCKSFICLLFCMMGLGVVSYSQLQAGGDSHTLMIVGVSLATASGITGAVRNVLEEVILQGDDLSTGGLMMCESWISLVGVVVTNLGWQAIRGNLLPFVQEAFSALCVVEVWVALFVIMACTYSKDFGKLFIVKHGSALIAKVLTMLFPTVTWGLSLAVFYSTEGQYGEGLEFMPSLIRLVGFFIIAFASITFVVLQQQKK